MSLYFDIFKCPNGHKRVVPRQTRSIGKKVGTYCTTCRKMFKALAGEPSAAPHTPQESK